MNKTKWLDAALIFDHWRVVPRFILFGYCWWIAYLTNFILAWYMKLPGPERTVEASGLVGVIITAVTGFGPWVYKIYSDSSTDWSANQTVQKSTVVSTETVSK